MAEKEVKRMEEVIRLSTEERGISVESCLHQDLLTIMNDNNHDIQQQFPTGSFRRLFWEEQLKCAQGGARQMRWHPTMIRWLSIGLK